MELSGKNLPTMLIQGFCDLEIWLKLPRSPLMPTRNASRIFQQCSFSISSEPKWKLEIVVQYLWKCITKPSTRTSRSNGFTEDTTFDGALKCFSNNTGTKSIIKKIGADVVQLLLAHDFQTQLSILSERNANDNNGGDREEGAGALVDLCQAFISAFDSLRSTDSDMEILSIGKEALFTAATVISMKS